MPDREDSHERHAPQDVRRNKPDGLVVEVDRSERHGGPGCVMTAEARERFEPLTPLPATLATK